MGKGVRVRISKKVFLTLLVVCSVCFVSVVGYAISEILWEEQPVPSPGHNGDQILVQYNEEFMTAQEYTVAMDAELQAAVSSIESGINSLVIGVNDVNRVSCSGSSSSSDSTCTASCADGEVILGGGCEASNSDWLVRASKPSGTTGWTCTVHANYHPNRAVGSGSAKGYVICATGAQ